MTSTHPYLTDEERERYPPVLSAPETIELLGIHRNTFYELAEQGLIPGCRKIGRRYRVVRDRLLDWIAGEDAGATR